MSKASKRDKEEALEMLHKLVKPGDTIYTVLRHVSQSGMSRRIDCFVWSDGIKMYLSGYMSDFLGYNRHKDGSLKVSGCGMDMGFAVVYELGRAMFPDGGDLELSPRKHQELRAGKTKETDGGYLLKHEWI